MAYENHRLVLSLTECFDDILHQHTVVVVKTVQGLVENQQVWVFYEGTCQQYQSLFTAG